MGLLSNLFGSDTHSQTTTSTSQVTNTQLAGQGISAPVVYGSNNNQTTNLIDAGTVHAATDISKAALQLGQQEASTGAAVAIAGLAHASDAYHTSLTLVGDVTHDSIAGYGDIVGKALDTVNKFATSALDANTYIAGKSLDSENQAYNAALGQVNALAQQVSQSSQQTTDTTITKVIVWLVIGVAAVFIFKKG